MTKLIMMAFLLASFVFISSCSFFTGSRSTASVENQCVALSVTAGFNTQNICVGERAYIAKTKSQGKIKEIDISGMENDKAETIFFLVEDKAGHKIRMTGKDIILSKKGLCIKANEDRRLCVGDRFNSLNDGNDRGVIGFSLSTVADKNVSVYSNGSNDGFIHVESPGEIFASIAATKTGMIQEIAICTETMILKTDHGLIKCAKKELIKKMDKVCDIFRHGDGRVLADIDTKSIKSECKKEYSMFGTSTKICTATLTAKCEKTKSSDGLVIIMPANSADDVSENE